MSSAGIPTTGAPCRQQRPTACKSAARADAAAAHASRRSAVLAAAGALLWGAAGRAAAEEQDDLTITDVVRRAVPETMLCVLL